MSEGGSTVCTEATSASCPNPCGAAKEKMAKAKIPMIRASRSFNGETPTVRFIGRDNLARSAEMQTFSAKTKPVTSGLTRMVVSRGSMCWRLFGRIDHGAATEVGQVCRIYGCRVDGEFFAVDSRQR